MTDTAPLNDAAGHGYRVVHARNVPHLVDRVSQAQQDGWVVTGGLVYSDGFYQAMVRGIPCSR